MNGQKNSVFICFSKDPWKMICLPQNHHLPQALGKQHQDITLVPGLPSRRARVSFVTNPTPKKSQFLEFNYVWQAPREHHLWWQAETLKLDRAGCGSKLRASHSSSHDLKSLQSSVEWRQVPHWLWKQWGLDSAWHTGRAPQMMND